MSTGTAWDLTVAATYASKSLAVGAQAAFPWGLTFSADGTKAYVLDFMSTVYQYTLTTPFDVSTGSYASKSMSVGAQDSSAAGLAFSADGTKAYMVGYATDTVYQYTLSTAWDISTGSYASKSMSVSAQETTPVGLAFSADGTKCYVVGDTTDTVYQYTLSTAWDIPTGSYASKSMSVSAQAGNPFDLAFSADGTKCYVMSFGDDTVYQYTLTTAWDISTGSYASKSMSVTSEEPTPRGVAISADGTKVYAVGNTNDTIYQYQLVTYELTGTVKDPSGSVIASADVRVFDTSANPYTEAYQLTADGSGVYIKSGLLENITTYAVYASTTGPPRRFGGSDNNLTPT